MSGGERQLDDHEVRMRQLKSREGVSLATHLVQSS